MDEMTTVTKDEFFARLYADPRDIMPRHADPDRTVWETRDRRVWGVTMPGWRDGGSPNVPKVYTVREGA